MAESATHMEQVARDLRLAYELGDTELFGALLAPDVTWGPPGDPPTCRSKNQVLAWYENGANAGARAQVQSIEIVGEQLLVGLVVVGTSSAKKLSRQAVRWQVLTVSGSRIVDIVGFEQKSDATAWMSHRAIPDRSV
ncbi:MAG TPA: nuclear transport factor 2 family protein [Acidimicrobiales bacterium]